MAANEYYSHSSSQPQPQFQPQPYLSYSQGRASPAPPSYTSHARPTEASPVSPFEAPFDDHVYSHRPQDSQYSLGHDSTFYSQGGGGRPQPGSVNSFRDDIPLRDHPKNGGGSETDHVYDAGDARMPPTLGDSGKSPSSRLGLGFFKKDGRIPWVVYIFTTIQVAVFIAEIVKNGKITVLILFLTDIC